MKKGSDLSTNLTKEQLENLDKDILISLFLGLQNQLEQLNLKIDQQNELISNLVNGSYG